MVTELLSGSPYTISSDCTRYKECSSLKDFFGHIIFALLNQIHDQ